MAQPEVVVLSGVRTAIGDFGGGLKDKPPTELGAAVVREAVKRAGVQPEDIEHVVFGNVIHLTIVTWVLLPRTSRRSGASRANNRTSWRYRVTNEPWQRSKQATSRSKSCRSNPRSKGRR